MHPLPVRSALFLGLLVSTACGSKAGSGVDSGSGGWDAPLGDLLDGKTMGTGGDSGAGESGTVADAPAVSSGGADGGGRDWVGGDRAYLPAHSPDGRIPDCIWTLLRQCCGAPGDRCVAMVGDGGTLAMCWPTGERETADMYIFSAYGSDGTLCFSVQPKPSINGYAFHNGVGQEVATYTVLGDGTWNIDVFCDGAMFRSSLPLDCTTVLGECYVGYCPL